MKEGRKALGFAGRAARRRLDRSILSGGVRRRRLGGQRGTRCRPEFNTGLGAASSLVFTEEVTPDGNPKTWSREIAFSTIGLSSALDEVTKGCAAGMPAEQTKL